MRVHLLLCALSILNGARAAVTVYNQVPFGQVTNTASAVGAQYTGAAAYDPTVLNPPAIPNPPPPNAFNLPLFSTNTTQAGLSILISGSFFGFSIEMSVVNQVRECGQINYHLNDIDEQFNFLTSRLQFVSGYLWMITITNLLIRPCSRRTLLQVPFLNLMANIAQRSGAVHIRVGGNTQERAALVDSLPNGRILMKDKTNVTNPVRLY